MEDLYINIGLLTMILMVVVMVVVILVTALILAIPSTVVFFTGYIFYTGYKKLYVS